MPTAKVTVTSRFPQYRREIESGVERALAHAGREVVIAAQHQPTRYRIHGILAKIRVTSVRRVRRGWEITVRASDFREIFFEKGTYRHRRAKLKQPGRRKAGSELRGGVKAGHHMARGLRATKPRLIRLLERELGHIKGLIR
jgi:hypothetical protein